MKKSGMIFLLLAIAITSCSAPDPDPEGAKKERLADEILHKVAAQLKRETQLYPIGTIGQMMYQIEILGLSFFYYQPVDIIAGRKLLVQAVNAMVEKVNQEKKIHPYLVRYPFNSKNIEIQIILRTSDGRDVQPGTLCSLGADEGMLIYKVYSAKQNELLTIYKETFDEALQRLADPSLPLVACDPDPDISPDELKRLRNGIRVVSDDGSIYHLDENGSWIQDRPL
jgi:hypothetical protein